VLELKNQVASFLLPGQSEVAQGDGKLSALEEDVLSALVNLGYPRAAAEKAVSQVLRSEECERTFEDVLRNTLRRLAG
jgi:Holliday junction resolvasome RuvABC DNA-binding subunit